MIEDIDYLMVLLLLAIAVLTSFKIQKTDSSDGSFISKDFSAFLKAICCVFIILHHYSLRNEAGALNWIFAAGGGISVFLCFSCCHRMVSQNQNSVNPQHALNSCHGDL